MIIKLLLSVFLLSFLIVNSTNAYDEIVLTVRMIETPIAPDSIYSPDMGIGYSGLPADEIINNYRRENGLGDFSSVERRRSALLINSEYSDESNLIHFRERHNRDGSIWQATDPDSNKWEIKEIRLKDGDCRRLGFSNRSLSEYSLQKTASKIYSFRASSTLMPSYPIYQAFLHDQDWVICHQTTKFAKTSESEFHLVINGIDLNEKHDYDNSMSAAYFRDHLFYLFEKDDEWGWSFNGVEGSERYGRVYHYFHDGEGSAFYNPSGFRGFYALRDGMWYFVIGQVVDESE